jgi:hypothetical protein
MLLIQWKPSVLDGPGSNGGLVVEPRVGAYGWPAVTFDGSAYWIAWADGAYLPTSGVVYTTRVTPAGALLDVGPMLVAPPPNLGTPGVIAYPQQWRPTATPRWWPGLRSSPTSRSRVHWFIRRRRGKREPLDASPPPEGAHRTSPGPAASS